MKVLMIDDDPATVEAVALVLQTGRFAGADLISASSGADGLELVRRESPDLVILDLGLPDEDGMVVLQRIRQFSDTPVIILTVRNERSAVVKGLEAGADDYVFKPFDPPLLRAQVQGVMRRSLRRRAPVDQEAVRLGDLVINFVTREVVRGRDPVKLSATEWGLLDCLMKNDGRSGAPQSALGEGMGVRVYR